MRRAIAQIAQHAHIKIQFRVVLKELTKAVPQGTNGEHKETANEFDRFWQSPQKQEATGSVAPKEHTLLPKKAQIDHEEAVSDSYPVVGQSQDKDGMVVRPYLLANTHTL